MGAEKTRRSESETRKEGRDTKKRNSQEKRQARVRHAILLHRAAKEGL